MTDKGGKQQSLAMINRRSISGNFFSTMKKKSAQQLKEEEKFMMLRSKSAKDWAKTLHAKRTLGGSENDIKLPPAESLEEWLSTCLVEIFNQILSLYGSICEHCTEETCPVMSANRGYRYAWRDGQKHKTPTEFPAPEYIRLLFEWVEGKLQNESIFPVEVGINFPPDCIREIKGMMKRLFRVYAHIYHKHFAEVQAADMTAALNSCLKHFVMFGIEFELIYREDMEPMKELLAKWKLWKRLPYKNARDSRRKGRRNSRMKRPNSRKTSPTSTPTPTISELTDNENGRSWIQTNLSPPISPRDVASTSVVFKFT